MGMGSISEETEKERLIDKWSHRSVRQGRWEQRTKKKDRSIHCFRVFALAVTSEGGLQASKDRDPNSRVCRHEALSTAEEDGVGEHLSQLDIHNSMGSVRMLFMVLMEPANVVQRPVSIMFKSHGDLGEVPVVWKANTNSISKKGDSGRFRPASFTCKGSRANPAEAISSHMKGEKVTGRSQHEFTKGKSCLTNFIHFYDEKTGSL